MIKGSPSPPAPVPLLTLLKHNMCRSLKPKIYEKFLNTTLKNNSIEIYSLFVTNRQNIKWFILLKNLIKGHSTPNTNVTQALLQLLTTRFKAGGAQMLKVSRHVRTSQACSPGSPPSASQASIPALHALSALNSAFPTGHPLSLQHSSWS